MRSNQIRKNIVDRGLNNQQAVIRKAYFISMFLLVSTFALGLDTVADDLGDTRKKNSIENGVPGFTPKSSVSSVIFDDTNGNRKQDAGEKGIAGLTVKLLDENGIEVNVGPDGTLGTLDDSAGGMITDASGGYHFDNLSPNTYRVVVIAQ